MKRGIFQSGQQWAWTGVLLSLFILGLGVRHALYEAQQRAYGKPPPFSLESAIQYRWIKMVYAGEPIPRVDKNLQYPQGIEPFRTDTLGAEYVYAALAHLFPSGMVLADRIRWLEVGWFSLGIPFMALWVGLSSRSRMAGALAGLFYAVSIAAVLRSTGQEISHENFALPLLLGHLACQAWARASVSAVSRGARWVPVLLSALCLAAALWTWDLIQYYVGLWALAQGVGWWRAAARPAPHPPDRLWMAPTAACLLVGVLSPYFRAHGWLYSPLVGLLLARAAGRLTQAFRPQARARTARLAALGVGAAWIGVGLLGSSVYRDSYGHFADLLWAKLRFFNLKPALPSLLNFNQRIMWTPSLQSATWADLLNIFPSILVLTILFIGLWFASIRHKNSRVSAEVGFIVFFHGISLAAFVLFFRFHVFAVLSGAALCGWLWALARAGRRTLRWTVAGLLALGWLLEIGHTLRAPEEWGRRNVYYRQMEELGGWLKQHAAPEAVLANFGISAFILTYGQCPVVLHPKFESPEIRASVQAYGERLFKGTEERFRDWAESRGASWYVYGVGEFSPRSPSYQMRYMVDALEPPGHAPARGFEYAWKEMSRFVFVWGNAKYRVFRIVKKADEAHAVQSVARAREALQRGELEQAGALATEALKRQPAVPGALDVLRHVNALLDQGFQSGGGEKAP